MLIDLHLKGVGPADEMSIAFKPRLNFITGDNGLGKSFLLDVAWWALTETWARGMALPGVAAPQPRIDVTRRIRGSRRSKDAPVLHEWDDDAQTWAEIDRPSETQPASFGHYAIFDRSQQAWEESGRPAACADVVLYARADGGISISEPYRSRLRRRGQAAQHALHFTADQLFEGSQPHEGEPPRLEGLIRDWAAWKREDGKTFEQLRSVLEKLSPETVLKPGELRRVSIDDSRHHPTIAMPYGEDVPLIHASAAIRRIASLAYALVWTWREHQETARLVFEEPKRSIVFLIDEVEAHLHPQWQRRIVPALLEVMEALAGEKVDTQVMTVTHSPLVLASIEPHFDPAQDAVWTLDLDDERKVTLEEFPFSRQGSADNWLTSEIFDLEETGSIEAEAALQRASTLLDSTAPDPNETGAVEKELRATLSDIDPFWVEWVAWKKRL